MVGKKIYVKYKQSPKPIINTAKESADHKQERFSGNEEKHISNLI